ncbi:MAG: glutamate-5-semialdehyde dehydrogenase [Clostridiales bacterium]|nr:glutamate-5-semialdehyde dehydrogenase [Clostridiales bacterium]
MSNEYLTNLGVRAKAAARELRALGPGERNAILEASAEALLSAAADITRENARDMEKAEASGVKPAFLDRLRLTEARIRDMAEGLRGLSALPDPLGETEGRTLPNGLIISKKRVPIGVAAVIYEARPNVTSDVFGICLKTGNACVLRGGGDAFLTSKIIVELFRAVIEKHGKNPDAVQVVTDLSRESAVALTRLNGLIDVVIPRGGAGLINAVLQNATVPVIETGAGNCHVYVDESADFTMARDIIINAKTQRPSVCNAAETLIIHKGILEKFMPFIAGALMERGVEIRADEAARAACGGLLPASEEDFYKEYNDLIIAVKTAAGLDDAIAHIEKYSTRHSEAIITENYAAAQKFLNEVDSAAVYVNASTRFTDGGCFGLGAEIGISTQKLHARGPMGLREMTTTKYVIYGGGQIRE